MIAAAAASGSSRQIQAAAFIAPYPERPQLVDVELDVAAAHRDDQPEADDDLGGGDRHHGDREDLAVLVAELPGERDQGEVRAVEHDLDREQDDQRAAADRARRARR